MSAAALAPGAIFARDYRIIAPLGHGGMGTLYVVEQISTAKRRALKLMHATLIPSAEHRERFVREAQIGSRIASEHVVEVTAAGVDEDTGMPYLAMELLEGETLQAYVKRRGFLPGGEVLTVFQQLCHAMMAAHAAGIVHRDLKPENVFLAVSRRAGGVSYVLKVLDFGIAKLAAEAGTHGTTGAMGSPLWMAPEQTERGTITATADVWALGLMAYFALTGTVFWRSARDPQTTVAHVLREIVLEPIPAATIRANEMGLLDRLPPGFDRFFARAVVREPHARMTDATSFWNALSTLLDVTGATLPGPALPPSGPPVTPYPVTPQPVTPMTPVIGTAPSVARTLGPTASAGPWIFGSAVVLALGVVGTAYVIRKSGAAKETITVQRNAEPQPIASVVTIATTAPETTAAPTQIAVAPSPLPTVAVTAPPAMTTKLRTATTGDVSHGTTDVYVDGTTKRRTWKVAGHTIRVVPGNVQVSGNVPADVVRDVIDWQPWEYLRCYEKYFTDATSLPHGTVTLAFKIFDQLPQKGSLDHSDFTNPAFSKCVLDTAMSNTANAAGRDGMATVIYPLVFTVVD